MKKINLLIATMIIFMNLVTINTKADINTNPIKPFRVGVLVYNKEDYFKSLIMNELMKIEEENKDTVDFIFYNAENNQELQNKQLDELINMKVDLIVVNPVEMNAYNSLVNKIKESNIPVIFQGGEPQSLDVIKQYNKALFIGSETCKEGNIQGEMIVDEFKNGTLIDRNKDNTFGYILLKVSENNIGSHLRGECAIKTINENGIKTKEIESVYCKWQRECGKEKTKSFFENHGNEIDMIISNNDEMAIGAVLAIQEMGYNTGDPKKYIPVVGIDGIEPAIKLVQEGNMTGTVIQNPMATANAIYKISMNILSKKPPLQGTPYGFDASGVAIRIPNEGYIIRKQLR